MPAFPHKLVGERTYVHRAMLPTLAAPVQALVQTAQRVAGVAAGEKFNLIRLHGDGQTLALLHYPGFDTEPFPVLRESWLVDLAAGSVSYRTWADSLNPPILHRKELLMAADDPRRAAALALSEAAEGIGLFDDPKRIGYQRQWLALIREKGYTLAGDTLVPLGNAEIALATDGDADDDGGPLHAHWGAARQRTALVRYGFSAPVQALARHGFLDGRYTLFDYGCGRGDDVRGLQENGLTAHGWDPYYAPDARRRSADLVNLGFVINVIESVPERVDALLGAWALTGTLLVVSVMLANQNAPRGSEFGDGVMTRRGTFQRYYTQAGIKAFLEQTLDQEALPVAPGVLYLFRDQAAEQRFLLARARGRRLPLGRLATPTRVPRPTREPGTTRAPRLDRDAARYAENKGPLEALWARWLDLGRPPEADEIADAAALCEGFGSLTKALRFLERHQMASAGAEAVAALLAEAARARAEDLTVYLALSLFDRRRPYGQLEPGLKRDVKAFFGGYPQAQAAGLDLLRRIADVAAIADACREAAAHGLGWLETAPESTGEAPALPRSLQLHTDLVAQLPALLRVYIGAAAAAYGDYRHADLLKVHIGSGKLTLMRFDDFDGQPLPRMVERVKIKLREQDVEYYAYGDDYAPPFLYRKSRFINEEHPRWPEQLAFDEALDALGFDLSGYGPSPLALLADLARRRWMIDGYSLRRAQALPDLDAPCGRFLTFRQLIECGETQAATGLANLPVVPDTYTALLELAEQVLDPVIDWFGMLRLTYGFCSPALARRIPGRIDPSRDQHAAHERKRTGKLVCARLGAAVDFLIEDEDMLAVARWLAANTPFDRLYIYGPDLPIHVSVGPDQSREVVLMRPGPSGRLIPARIALERFLAASD